MERLREGAVGREEGREGKGWMDGWREGREGRGWMDGGGERDNLGGFDVRDPFPFPAWWVKCEAERLVDWLTM